MGCGRCSPRPRPASSSASRAGRTPGALGTSAPLILDAVRSVLAASPEGAVVLLDLGSAALALEMALDDLEPAERAVVRVSRGALVEGAVRAAVEAAGGGSLASVVAASETPAGRDKLPDDWPVDGAAAGRDRGASRPVSGALVVAWLRLAASRVAAERMHLTELDAAIGDGDHGINLDRGFAALEARLSAPDASMEARGPAAGPGRPDDHGHGRRRQRRALRTRPAAGRGRARRLAGRCRAARRPGRGRAPGRGRRDRRARPVAARREDDARRARTRASRRSRRRRPPGPTSPVALRRAADAAEAGSPRDASAPRHEGPRLVPGRALDRPSRPRRGLERAPARGPRGRGVGAAPDPRTRFRRLRATAASAACPQRSCNLDVSLTFSATPRAYRFGNSARGHCGVGVIGRHATRAGVAPNGSGGIERGSQPALVSTQ